MWAGLGKPEAATGGGIRRLLWLEPGASYAFSAHGRHAARPRGVSVVGVRLKLADGSNRNFALEFDGTVFARTALDFDLAARQPDVVARMLRELHAWQRSVEQSLTGADYHR